ncbi:hypothetical protein D4R87_00360, partial [bacterium]
ALSWFAEFTVMFGIFNEENNAVNFPEEIKLSIQNKNKKTQSNVVQNIVIFFFMLFFSKKRELTLFLCSHDRVQDIEPLHDVLVVRH